MKTEKIELTGVQIPQNGYNKCYKDGCDNNAMTSVFGYPIRWEKLVCGWHLKKNLESGKWKV